MLLVAVAAVAVVIVGECPVGGGGSSGLFVFEVVSGK